MGLAPLMILAISVMFALGAAIALIWSFATGQWHDTTSAAHLVLDERELAGWEMITNLSESGEVQNAG